MSRYRKEKIRVSLPLLGFLSHRRENESFFEDNDEDDEVDDGDDEDDERKKSGKKLEACRRPIPRDNVVPVLETSVLVRA